jgi:hypothetical protein
MRMTEGYFVEIERARVFEDAAGAPWDAAAFVRWFEALRERGPGQGDALFPWLATRATLEQMRWFLTQEAAGEAGFDDLVALAQVKLQPVRAKLEMARNYWDEMGRGSLRAVHTELHRRLSTALGLRAVPRAELPPEALLRSALGSLLATNRYLQPELVGALGLIELQAGPRSRRVVGALRRLGAAGDALAFYEEHAHADPRHGKAWVDHVVGPLAADPVWSAGIVRGARWRSLVNERFFTTMGAAPLVSVDG